MRRQEKRLLVGCSGANYKKKGERGREEKGKRKGKKRRKEERKRKKERKRKREKRDRRNILLVIM